MVERTHVTVRRIRPIRCATPSRLVGNFTVRAFATVGSLGIALRSVWSLRPICFTVRAVAPITSISFAFSCEHDPFLDESAMLGE
jgi:hypothetical protein